MKRIIVAALLALSAATANAWPQFDQMEQTPEVIPCASKDGVHFECLWNVRSWEQYMDRRQRRMITLEGYFMVNCSPDGKCYHQRTQEVAGYGRQPIKALINHGYYLGLSAEGKPVSYRADVGPLAGKYPVTLREAGDSLLKFLTEQNVDQAMVERFFTMNYPGGWAGYQAVSSRQVAGN